MLDKDFNIDACIFRSVELMELMETIPPEKKGKVIVWDESGIELSSRSWQSTVNKMMNFFLQTFRHRNIILLFTVPYTSFLDAQTRKLLHATFETRKIHTDKKAVEIKPKYLQYNSGLDKTYEHYLQREFNGRWQLVKKWLVPKPSKELIESYEEKKLKFTSQLNNEIKMELTKYSKTSSNPVEMIFSKPEHVEQNKLMEQDMSAEEISKTQGVPLRTVYNRWLVINKKRQLNGFEMIKTRKKKPILPQMMAKPLIHA